MSWKRPHRRLSCRRQFSLVNERNENIPKMCCSPFRSACNLSSAFSMRSRCEISKFGQFIIYILLVGREIIIIPSTEFQIDIRLNNMPTKIET